MNPNILSKTIVQQIQDFPPYLLEELSTYVAYLSSKRKTNKERKFRLNWAGAIESEKGNYTSVELQKKALEWRNS